jgi:HTH-type transcriptional regulator sarZ
MKDRCICLPLYLCSKELIKVYKKYLDKYDLTYTQYICINELLSEGTLYVKELGERLYLDSGTLTPVLKKLESKGYVRRVRCNKDERNLCVSITESGKELEKGLDEVYMKVKADVGISDEDSKVLLGVLDKLLSRVVYH